jgi:hypothetical protein
VIDPHAKLKSYLQLMLLVAILGAVSAVITFVFIALVNQLTDLVWKQAPLTLGVDAWLFTLLVCTIGGLLVGLLVKLFGDHNAIFSELIQEFGKTGRFDYRHAPITAWLPNYPRASSPRYHLGCHRLGCDGTSSNGIFSDGWDVTRGRALHLICCHAGLCYFRYKLLPQGVGCDLDGVHASEVQLAQVHGEVRDRLRQAGLITQIDEKRIFLDVAAAVYDFEYRAQKEA